MSSNDYDDLTDFKVLGFIKTQNSKYLNNEKLFYLQKEKPFMIF